MRDPYANVVYSGGPTSFQTATSSQSAQDVPVAPMSCLILAITELFSRIDHKAKVCLKIHLFVSTGVHTYPHVSLVILVMVWG